MILRDIPGYEGHYAATVTGHIWSHKRKIIRKDHSNGIGYRILRLSKDGVVKAHSVHRLVAAAFHGPCPEGMEVCHLDGSRDNNRPDNLMYGTHLENMRATRRA